MILKIIIKVENKIEAYKIVSELGMEHDVVLADLDGYQERFSVNNPPVLFMRNNKKITGTSLQRFQKIKQEKQRKTAKQKRKLIR